LTVDALPPKGWTARLSSYFSRSKYNPVALGDAMRDARDWEKAVGYYKRALDFNPRNQPIWIQYGHALKESGRLREAEAAYRRAVEINPRDAEARLQLGHSNKVQGNLKAAVDSYLEGFRLDPSNTSIVQELRHLGWTRSALNRVNGTEPDDKGTLAGSEDVMSPDDIPVPISYTEVFPDVQALIAMGLVDSAEQHFALYGFKQGRDILATFANTKPSAAFVLCPSFFKRCGIGEHSRYLANSIESSGLTTYRIRSTRDLVRFNDNQLRDAVLVVNHGPGLFDGYNPELSEGEATADLLTILRRYFRSHNLRPILFLHSLLDRDNTVMFPRQQMALEYPIPAMTTIEAAARTFNIPRVEHGMQPIDCPEHPVRAPNSRDLPTIGFFGFFQWGGKNFDALFTAAERAKAKLVGSVATSNDSQVANLRTILEKKSICCNLGTGWVEDSELAERLNEADFYYLPQQDYDHWNNSGTARFVMNFGRPVIVPPHNPFLDLRSFAIFADDRDLPQIIAHLRDEGDYDAACERITRYGQAHSMNDEMPALAERPHILAADSGLANFLDVNKLCASALLSLPADQFNARIDHFRKGQPVIPDNAPFSPQRVEAIRQSQANLPSVFGNDKPIVLPLQYWRAHYDIAELIYANRLEQIYAGVRSILKREPDLHDLTRYGIANAKANQHDAKSIVAESLLLFGQLVDNGHALEFARQVKLYHQGRQLNRLDLDDKALIERVSIDWARREGLIDKGGRDDRSFANSNHYINIVDIVTYSERELQGQLEAVADKCDARLDFSKIVGIARPMARFLTIADCIARSGRKLTDFFVIDEPIVNPIDPARKHYSIGAFYLLSGNFFLCHAIRCLLKRDPLAAEIMFLDDIYQTSGRLPVLRNLLEHTACQAEIVDLDHYDEDRLIADAREALTIGREFRSVYAGGWDQRNAYLEAKRNEHRFWLHTKRQQDRMYSQSGERAEAIRSVITVCMI
jgi:hypothetical protein